MDADLPVGDTVTVYETPQVKDYSKIDMAGFSEEHKRSMHEMKFPKDLDGIEEPLIKYRLSA